MQLDAFEIARTPVTNGEYAAFVDSGGYTNRGHWSHEGWRWRVDNKATRPNYWEGEGEGEGEGGGQGEGNEECKCVGSEPATLPDVSEHASGHASGRLIRRFDQKVPLEELMDHPVAHLTYWEVMVIHPTLFPPTSVLSRLLPPVTPTSPHLTSPHLVSPHLTSPG